MPDLQELLKLVQENVEFDTNGGCWLWTGPILPHPQRLRRPRGMVHALGRRWLAHRLSFYAASGVSPDGHFVCHRCDVSLCVNPDHLYAGDHRSNMRDMRDRRRYFAAIQPQRNAAIFSQTASAQRHTRGEGNPKARLSASAVAAIRESSRPTKLLAQEHRVDRTTIQRIRRGALWKSF